jgi:hypothetical protein
MFQFLKVNSMKNFRILLTAAFVILAVNACQKDDITANDDLLIDQETVSEQTAVDLDALVDEALGLKIPLLKSATVDGYFYMNNCPVVTLNLTGTPRLVTIDFGTGCTGKDGKVRSGKILVTSTTLENLVFDRVKTFENFTVDGRKIEGTITKKVTLDRVDHSRVANIKEDISVTFPENGGKATRKSDMTREYQLFMLGWTKDNVIKSWGTSEFTRVSGVKLSKTITEANPLVFKMECHQIVSGVVSFKTSDNRSWSIDYGTGECDNKATVTKDGETKVINLRK